MIWKTAAFGDTLRVPKHFISVKFPNQRLLGRCLLAFGLITSFLLLQIQRAAAEVDPNFYIFLFIGQSNMAGINTADPEDYVAPDRVFKFVNSGTWAPGSIPVTYGNTGSSTNPSRTFGQTVANALPSVRVGLLNTAVSGSPVSSWQDGQTNYTTTIQRLQAALSTPHPQTGKTGVLKGVVWHQGEADSGNSNYQADLANVIINLRRDTGIPDLPFIMGMLSTAGNSTMHLRNYSGVLYTGHASSYGLVLADNVHYNAASQRIYGARYANSWLKMMGLLPADQPRIENQLLPPAGQNQPYSVALQIGGTTGPVTCTALTAMPAGLTLTGTVISGTRTGSGFSVISIQVDSGTKSCIEPVVLRTGNPAPTSPRLDLLSTFVPNAYLGTAFSSTNALIAFSDRGPITWSIGQSGTNPFPPGLTINGATAALSRKPLGVIQQGSYMVSATAQDTAGSSVVALPMRILEGGNENTLINYQGAFVGTATKVRDPVTSGTVAEFAWNPAVSGSFFATDSSFAQFTGGARAVTLTGTVSPTFGNYALRTADWGSYPNQYYFYTGIFGNSGTTSMVTMALFWPSELFSPQFAKGTIHFGTTSWTGRAEVEVFSNATTIATRLIVRDGTSYYISEQSGTKAGFVRFDMLGTGTGTRWAAFDPATDAFSLPSSPTWASRSFTDITGMGVWYQATKTGQQENGIGTFTVYATDNRSSADRWKIKYFGSTTDPKADLLADPDKDGIPNGMEIALGTSPFESTPDLQFMNLGMMNGTPTLSTAVAYNPELLPKVEHSADLVGWSTLYQAASGEVPSLQTVTLGQSFWPNHFFRVKFAQ